SSNALAVFVYRLMPNGTDFTIAADRGLAGVNLAFIGRPAQYHSSSSTPEALDQGSVQHIGAQALETADALLRAPTLPQATRNLVYSDVFGLAVLRHGPETGWGLLGLALGLTAFAAWGARHATGLTWRQGVKGFTGGYLRLLNLAIRHPGKIVALGVALLIATQVAYGTFGKGVEFFPEVEPDNAVLQVHARGNLSIWERDALLQEVEGRIMELQQESGEFHAIYARSTASSGTQGDEAEDIIGTVQLEFTDWFTRRSADAILEDIRARTADLAGITVEPRKQEAGPPVGKPVQLQVSAQDPEMLAPVADRIVQAMTEVGGFVDIEDGKSVPGIEWVLRVDREEAAKYGADVSLIGAYVKMLTNGLKVTDYRPATSTDEVDVILRLPETYRTLSQLDRVRVETDLGPVPISRFVEREAQPKVSLLRRVDGNRAITVKADVGIDPATGAPFLVADKVAQLQQALSGEELPPGVQVEFRGEDEEQREAQEFLSSAFLVALGLIAVVLLTQFNSFFSVGLILVAVIMSTIGVFLGLLITDQPFGIVMCGIGVIALAGIVVNNNIVLIDTFDTIRPNCVDTRDAILRTGAQRLRPVMLTTITTILGLIPMVMQVNIDFISRAVTVGAPSTQWWVALATAIVYGLAFATVLTLVVTPCALMFRDTAAAGWRGFKDRVGGLFNRGRGSKSEDAGGGSGGPEPQAAE
ncbi:efflux RND transporter permease subunit, partial [Thalassobaculum salexigens]|uniref:efflux RND transporter permease subunit n=1 Tax=Thalassobaculum salexigens TaxID=455360 RepID=UPI00248F09AC